MFKGYMSRQACRNAIGVLGGVVWESWRRGWSRFTWVVANRLGNHDKCRTCHDE